MNLSKYLEDAVNQVASLPGVGRRTALRYVLDLVKRDREEIERFVSAISNLKEKLTHCQVCHNISDAAICHICSNPQRDKSIICVVEDMRDILAIESTHQYRGIYHVLGGKISPMDGIGPSDLNIGTLIPRLAEAELKEIILALSPTMEGDTTAYFLYKKLGSAPDIKLTTLSRGVSVGDELQYADELTLGRSIVQRLLYEKAIEG